MQAGQGEAVSLAARHHELVDALRANQSVPAGRLLGLPELPEDDVWVDVAGAAALAGVNPKTITGWRSRGGPKRKPFPPPRRVLYRLYWARSAVLNWLQE